MESALVLLAKESLFLALTGFLLADFVLFVALAEGGAVEFSSAFMDSNDRSVSSRPYSTSHNMNMKRV